MKIMEHLTIQSWATQNQGINLPEILKLAIETKGEAFVSKHSELVQQLAEAAEALKH